MSKPPMLLLLMMCALRATLSADASAQGPPGRQTQGPVAEKERGADVVTDSTLFSEKVVNAFRGTIQEKKTLMLYVEQEGRPRIVDVIAKHGKPDKVADEEWTTDFAPGRGFVNATFVAHYYGRFALGVRKGDPDQGVEYVSAKAAPK